MNIIVNMGLAFEAIYPEVYPLAYEYFVNGTERYWVAGKLLKHFGEKHSIPENELNTAMIDLSISCAENDFKNKLDKDTTGRLVEDRNIARLLRLDEKEC